MRAATALAAGVGVTAVAVLTMPSLFANPQDGLDPIVRHYLLDLVSIEDPLRLSAVTWSDLLFDVGPVVPALLFAAAAAVRGAPWQRRAHLFHALALLLMLAYVLFGKARGLHFLALYQVIPWSAATLWVWHRASVRGGRALAAAAAVLLVGAGWMAAAVLTIVATPVPDTPQECRYGPVARHLPPARAGETVLTDLFDGPELAYRTGYGAIGAPYDLNAAGIRDTQALLLGDPHAGCRAGDPRPAAQPAGTAAPLVPAAGHRARRPPRPGRPAIPGFPRGALRLSAAVPPATRRLCLAFGAIAPDIGTRAIPPTQQCPAII
jgi:hypothetical protein